MAVAAADEAAGRVVQQLRHQMTARGIAGDEEPLRVDPVIGAVAVQPEQRLAARGDDVGELDPRDQRVIDQHEGGAEGHEAVGEKGEIAGLHGGPEAAVEEHLRREQAGPRAKGGKISSVSSGSLA